VKKKIKLDIDIRNITPEIVKTLHSLFEAKGHDRGTPSEIITETLQNGFATFLNLVPARRLGQHVRKLLLYYLQHEVEDGVDGNFEESIKYLGDFFDFLDMIEEEYDQSAILEPINPINDK
jgi:hypothetical protein